MAVKVSSKKPEIGIKGIYSIALKANGSSTENTAQKAVDNEFLYPSALEKSKQTSYSMHL